jgi:hypothetical protein
MTAPLLRTMLTFVVAAILLPAAARAQADAKDWPTYNHDVLGSRYNRGETAIDRNNAGRLEEKWRFPAMGSGQEADRTCSARPVVGQWAGGARKPKLLPDRQFEFGDGVWASRCIACPCGQRSKRGAAALSGGTLCR